MLWPYHRVEEEETSTLVLTFADTLHVYHTSSSPGWADPTRIPDDPTHVTDLDKDDVSMT